MKRCISALAAAAALALGGGVANAYAGGNPGDVLSQPSGSQSQGAVQAATNTAGDTSQSFENGGGAVTNVGGNNNTVQLGTGQSEAGAPLGPTTAPSGGSNQSNGNTNTAGNTTAVIGNNAEQSNTQGQSQNQQSSGGSCCESDNQGPAAHPSSCGCDSPKQDAS